MTWETKWLLTILVIAVISGGFIVDNIRSYEPKTTDVKEVSSYCEPLEVRRVIDGDTLETAEGETLRLGGIDTPEVGEKGVEEATEALERYVRADTCFIATDIGYYGRTIAWIYNEKTGENINRQMLEDGLAEIYE